MIAETHAVLRCRRNESRRHYYSSRKERVYIDVGQSRTVKLRSANVRFRDLLGTFHLYVTGNIPSVMDAIIPGYFQSTTRRLLKLLMSVKEGKTKRVRRRQSEATAD